MNIIVVGTGYVGLVQGVCLAELGNHVTCIDIEEEKIALLRKGQSPIYEPGLEELLVKNIKTGRINFDTSIDKHIKDNEVIFIAVGTPPDENGRADLKYVLQAATEIGQKLNSYQIIVNKSTVPIGTGQMCRNTIKQYYKGDFDVVSNPEFLREGSAINDWMQPDRVIIGYSGQSDAAKKIAELYAVLEAPTLITNLETAEMIKYASNSYLATQISFINTLSRICDRVGADIEEVAEGMKLDKRIGPKAFLSAGLGYGGSCFPKDVEALIKIARDLNIEFSILEATDEINKSQRQEFIHRIKNTLNTIDGKKITIWGAAFKPKTDDLRESPAITIIEALSTLGAKITVYDPVAGNKLQAVNPDIILSDDAMSACQKADALIIVTEWDEFKQIDLEEIKSIMHQPIIFDGRNIYNPKTMTELGFNYYSIGRNN